MMQHSTKISGRIVRLSGPMRLIRVEKKTRAVGVSHRDDDFSLGVSFFEIPESFWDLTQLVTSIDDRRYFAGFKKLFHEAHVLLV